MIKKEKKKNIKKKNTKLNETLKNKNEYYKEKENKSLVLLNDILKGRDLRGILYLHWEFINSCKDLSKITFNDFVNVLEIQHINLSNQDMKNIFNNFSSKKNKNYFDFSSLISNYKKKLN